MDSTGEFMEMSLYTADQRCGNSLWLLRNKVQMVDQLHLSPGTHPMGDLTSSNVVSGLDVYSLEFMKFPCFFVAEEFKTPVTSLTDLILMYVHCFIVFICSSFFRWIRNSAT